MKGPSRRRESDEEEGDWRPARAPITGDEEELSLGAGKYRLTAKGGRVILIIGVISVLGLVAYGIRENDKIAASVSSEHKAITERIDRTLRMQTCVLSMTPEERIQWRNMRDAPLALASFCPGLLVHNGHVQ